MTPTQTGRDLPEVKVCPVCQQEMQAIEQLESGRWLLGCERHQPPCYMVRAEDLKCDTCGRTYPEHDGSGCYQ